MKSERETTLNDVFEELEALRSITEETLEETKEQMVRLISNDDVVLDDDQIVAEGFDILLDSNQVAAILNRSRGTLGTWMKSGVLRADHFESDGLVSSDGLERGVWYYRASTVLRFAVNENPGRPRYQQRRRRRI